MPESLTVLAIISFVAAAVWSLILREAHDLMPLGATWLVRRIAAMTPGDQEERDLRAQIWENDLGNVPGKLYKLMWALRLLPAPWTLWRDEYECNPAILALAVWSRRSGLNYWFALFPPHMEDLTPGEEGLRQIFRIAVEQSQQQRPALAILNDIRQLPPSALRNGGLLMLKLMPRLYINQLVRFIVEHPRIGVPEQERHRIVELVPLHLKYKFANSIMQHCRDPLFLLFASK